MDIIEEYETYISKKKYAEALPIIEELVGRSPHIATSWFNWGVCLDCLGRYSEAVEKFKQAYILDPNNYGNQYRIFRSLFLSNDIDGFCKFAKSEFINMPEIFEILSEQKEFATFTKQDEFQKYYKNGAA